MTLIFIHKPQRYIIPFINRVKGSFLKNSSHYQNILQVLVYLYLHVARQKINHTMDVF